MSAAHTPGPWYVGLIPSERTIITSHGFKIQAIFIPSERTIITSHGFKIQAIPLSGSGRAIGCIYAGDARPERRAPEDPTVDANARLIAAAPELLSALRGVLDRWDAAWSGDGTDEEPKDIVAARAAIAKAVAS